MGEEQGCFGYYGSNQKLVKECILELYKYTQSVLLAEQIIGAKWKNTETVNRILKRQEWKGKLKGLSNISVGPVVLIKLRFNGGRIKREI